MWIAYLLIGLIATGETTMTTGPHPFGTIAACESYLEDVVATIKTANAGLPEDRRMMMMGDCVVRHMAQNGTGVRDRT